MDGNEIRRVARIDKGHLAELPVAWTDQERGGYLQRLLRGQGLDPGRFFRSEYYPHHHCWLLIQEHDPAAADPAPRSAAAFYRETIAELRRVARTACAALAARSLQFARCGGPYELPAVPQEILPGDLASLVGPPAGEGPPVRFDSQGGWRIELQP